jgi:hypothetical protein
MTEDEFLEILDVQMETANNYRDICLSFIDNNDLTSETWFSLVMSSQFNWLRQKFTALWHETAFDDFLNRTRPQYGLFTPTDFEELVQSIMYLVFGKYYEATKGSHDEGIDLIITEMFTTEYSGMEISETSIVQCKLYRNPVPVSEVRDFFGVMVSRTATGYFFTTSTLSNQAVAKFLPMANASSMANRFHVVTNEYLEQLFDICEVMADEVIDAFLKKRPLDEILFYSERKKAKKIVRDPSPQQTSLF